MIRADAVIQLHCLAVKQVCTIRDIGPIFMKETKQPLSTLRIVISLLILLHATKAFVLNTFDLRSNLLLFRFTACAKESDSN